MLGHGQLYERTRQGRGPLLNQTGRLTVDSWGDRVDHVVDTCDRLDAPAVLLRPDGHVAWAGGNQHHLRDRLSQLFGR